MPTSAYAAWMKAGIDTWALGFEASAVIGLRMAKYATGGDLDGKEARLMMAEKLASAWALPFAMVGLSPLAGTRTMLGHHRGKVSANRKRLARGR